MLDNNSKQIMNSNDGLYNQINLAIPPKNYFYEQRKLALTRQLEIEIKIKSGAENMLQTFSQGPKKDKKLCDDANSMLKDAKLKIEYIKMQLNKINNLINEGNTTSLYGIHNRTSEENICNFYNKKLCL
jgi:hypothetical protein